MESNEQNKLTNKIERGPQVQKTDRQLSEEGGLGRLGEKEGIMQKKNPHRHKPQFGDYLRENGCGEG